MMAVHSFEDKPFQGHSKWISWQAPVLLCISMGRHG